MPAILFYSPTDFISLDHSAWHFDLWPVKYPLQT